MYGEIIHRFSNFPKFENGSRIASQISLGMWLLTFAEIKPNPC